MGFFKEIKEKSAVKSAVNIKDICIKLFEGYKNNNYDETEIDRLGNEFAENFKLAMIKETPNLKAVPNEVVKKLMRPKVPMDEIKQGFEIIKNKT